MTEVEKMRSSQLADMSVPELQVRFEHARNCWLVCGDEYVCEGYRKLLE